MERKWFRSIRKNFLKKFVEIEIIFNFATAIGRLAQLV